MSLEFPVPLSMHNTPLPFSIEFSDLHGPSPIMSNYKNSTLTTPTVMPAQATVISCEPKSKGASTCPDTIYTVYDKEEAYGEM